MKKKIAILGSSHLLQSVNFDDLSKIYTLVTTRIDMSLVSLMSYPIEYDRQKLLSGEDKNLASRLLSEYEKDTLNDLIASNPDVIILDFFPDIQFGVSETLSGCYITNNLDDYTKNPSFENIRTFLNHSPVYEFDHYEKIWAKSLEDFITFINKYLPKTKVMIYQNLEVTRKYSIENGVNLINNFSNEAWKNFNQFASETYNLSIISDLFEIDLSSGDTVDNNIYDFNLIRNATFDNEGKFWTCFGYIPFDDKNTRIENGELILYGNRNQIHTFNILSGSINFAASPENPIELELSYEVFVEDIFDIEIYHDYIFIGKGFDNNLDVSNNDASQILYDQGAKLLNLTSGKWKKIKKIVTVTAPYIRVGPYVKGKTTVKWRNLSLKHHCRDEK
ncbi:hypothetical protein P7H38_10425 [Lactococcus raffinolactis]|uniref:DUF6270 domain-containing protein n=1 Tax=Pseudolactococcus raffinolactis TaxID=1366 RepID=UPI002891D4A9|nr:DUF6270 domain-containing protein [Lactococcus raffinolactis]MDT2767088.1 hypothetical protein [Lactococcus raffinolactis]MDT2790224.1 hypothetical protein [Lactococcus raffinolactis]